MSKMGAHVLEQQEAAAAAGDPFEQMPAEPVLGTLEVLPPELPIAAYNPIRAAIAKLTEQYGNTVFDVTTTAGMEAAKQARMAIREPRYKVEHIRKELKAPALAYSKRIDDEAAEYKAALLAIETPIDEQIKAREKAIEDERIAKEKDEAEARRKVDQAIADIQFYAVHAAGKCAADILLSVAELEQMELTEDTFGARVAEAVLVKNATLTKLRDMHGAAEAQEAESRRLQAEREEAERVRQEQAAEAARLEKMRQDLQQQQAIAVQQSVLLEPAHAMPAGSADGQQTARRYEAVPRSVPADLDDSDPFAAAAAPAQAQPADPAPPTPGALIAIVAEHYDVATETAEKWLRDAFGE